MTAENFGSAYDTSLLNKLRSRDARVRNTTWTRIYDDNYSMAKSLMQRLGTDPDNFSDIYHDAFDVLIINIETGKFRWRARISTYLYAVCKNICMHRFKVEKRKLEAETAYYDQNEAEPGYDFDRDILLAQAATILKTELRGECRIVLEKFYFHEWSMEQIRAHFNLGTVQAAKNKKMRCMRYYKIALKKYSINPELFKR